MKGKRLIIVEWLDHSEGSGWRTIEEIKGETVSVFTVGWLLTETDTVMVLAPSYNVENGRESQVFGEVSILKSAIVSTQSIASVRGRKPYISGKRG